MCCVATQLPPHFHCTFTPLPLRSTMPLHSPLTASFRCTSTAPNFRLTPTALQMHCCNTSIALNFHRALCWPKGPVSFSTFPALSQHFRCTKLPPHFHNTSTALSTLTAPLVQPQCINLPPHFHCTSSALPLHFLFYNTSTELPPRFHCSATALPLIFNLHYQRASTALPHKSPALPLHFHCTSSGSAVEVQWKYSGNAVEGHWEDSGSTF